MDIVIVGAGGHGKVVLEILRSAESHRIAGFLDADSTLSDTQVAGLPVLGQINLLPRLRQQKIRGAVVAIGDNRVRSSYAKLVVEAGLELIRAIHPTASVAQTAQIGQNVAIAAGAVVCTEVKLGDSVIVNSGAVIDHECEIGAGSHICPGALLAGRVRVGEGAFIGLGAKILPCLNVGEHATVGAGATVIRDVPPAMTVVGTPARALRTAA
jgi:UDP-perosamine 4-acetyltransferase